MQILIADDSVLLREGLRLILTDAGHHVVADVGDGETLYAEALARRPDLLIVDIRMPPSHTDEGLRAAVRIRSAWPEAPILLLSQYVVLSYAQELLAAGGHALGYLLKDRVSDIDDFLDAVERVAHGGFAMDPEVVQQVFSRQRRNDPVQGLTQREREVLELMAQGHSNARIAAELVVTEGAVEKHTQRIFAKLGLQADAEVHRRVSAVLMLLRAPA